MLTFKMKNTRFLLFVTFIFFILLVRVVDASHKKKHKKTKTNSPSPSPSPPASSSSSPSPPQSSYGSGSNIFNVIDYGAKGDGHTDNTEAFSNTWAKACLAENPVMLVPSGVFGVKQVSFSGDCKSRMVFQLDGTIIAPASRGAYSSGLLQWLEFTKLEGGLTIQGKGTIEGNGQAWWSENGGTKPTAVRVADSDGVLVTGITIQNSQQTHLKFDNCNGVEVSDITVSSPGDSPNTDGIHLQNSQNVHIHEAKIGCGDDCISIQTGCSAININKVDCGPSHGISIGSLGKDGSTACVKNVTVTDSSVAKSQNGLRIKTWQGGSGSVTGVSFSNIEVLDVDNAMIIDQHYCDGGCSSHESGAVAIRDVSFTNIRGTFNLYPVNFACSSDIPCNGITLSSIHLTASEQGNLSPFCENAYGTEDNTEHCLQSGGSSSSPSSSKQSDNGNVC